MNVKEMFWRIAMVAETCIIVLKWNLREIGKPVLLS